jgi:transcriptional regulator with XRE-family HTH domain
MSTVDSRLRELGRRLRTAREACNETQAATAGAAGVHRTHLTNIERGRENITVSTLYRIADHLGVPASSLLPD